ncbi:MAG: 2-C-methyl-D-erythritol 4-phosphate cytidylyltransferase [Phycisphaerae bacterium]|nr:2-C-methyl-D-erythritol 4-phosphate cytidylyltransferase [Phycisphaerae bacterium]
MRICVIIAAAGASRRYSQGGGVRHKLDEDLGGKPVLQRTVEAFTKNDRVATIVVAGPADPESAAEFRSRYGDRLGLLGAALCEGGPTHRWETVRNALAHAGDCTHIAVHDAARPCFSLELLDRLFDAAERYPAVIPVVEISDTVKRIRETDEAFGGDDPVAAILGVNPQTQKKLRIVSDTLSRQGLCLVQTPQVFEASLLRRAYAQADLTSTDDAGLVERLGERVVVVEGEARNIKITHPTDLDLARAILGVRPPEGRPVHKRF